MLVIALVLQSMACTKHKFPLFFLKTKILVDATAKFSPQIALEAPSEHENATKFLGLGRGAALGPPLED